MILIKKLIILFPFYFLMSFIDELAKMFFGNTVVSFIIASIVCGILAYGLRIARLYKRNFDSEYRKNYNDSFKNSLLTVINTEHFRTHFILELILGAFITLIFAFLPGIAYGMCYVFEIFYYQKLTALLFYLYFVVLNFVMWYLAYRKVLKKKKYKY